MPGPTPPAVPLSEAERHALHTLIRAHKTPQHLSFRAHVILSLAEGLTAPEVARRLGTTRTTVRRWRRHWLKRHGGAVAERLQDAPRPGAPATFRAEQWCQIIALACEPPEASERPISHWTPRARADEGPHTRHGCDHLRAPCRAFCNIRSISNRTRVAPGSMRNLRPWPVSKWPT
jgi:transposase-like protein